MAASLGCLALPAWSQSAVPGAEVISVEAVETTVVEVEGAEPLPTKPLRINTGLVTIESDQQQADQQTGVITARGNVRIVYPDERVVATARQAQYFSNEGRVVLSGDVDILQDGGNWLGPSRSPTWSIASGCRPSQRRGSRSSAASSCRRIRAQSQRSDEFGS